MTTAPGSLFSYLPPGSLPGSLPGYRNARRCCVKQTHAHPPLLLKVDLKYLLFYSLSLSLSLALSVLMFIDIHGLYRLSSFPLTIINYFLFDVQIVTTWPLAVLGSWLLCFSLLPQACGEQVVFASLRGGLQARLDFSRREHGISSNPRILLRFNSKPEHYSVSAVMGGVASLLGYFLDGAGSHISFKNHRATSIFSLFLNVFLFRERRERERNGNISERETLSAAPCTLPSGDRARN